MSETLEPWYRTTRNWRIFVILAVLSVFVAVGLTIALRTTPMLLLAVRDVAAIARDGIPLQFFAGWITYLGVIGWFASATVLGLGASTSLRNGRTRDSAFLAGTGIISLLLGVDDLFMLHDGAIATGETALVLFWLTLVLAWVGVFRDELLRDPLLPVLGLAGAFFGLSLVADATHGALALVHEDAAKLAAIVLLTSWSWALAERVITSAVRDRAARELASDPRPAALSEIQELAHVDETTLPQMNGRPSIEER